MLLLYPGIGMHQESGSEEGYCTYAPICYNEISKSIIALGTRTKQPGPNQTASGLLIKRRPAFGSERRFLVPSMELGQVGAVNFRALKLPFL